MSWKNLSDSAKQKQKEYNQKNYSVIGCKLPRELADSFRAYCASQEKSVSAVLADFVKATLASESQDQPQPAENDTPGPVVDTPDSV